MKMIKNFKLIKIIILSKIIKPKFNKINTFKNHITIQNYPLLICKK
jgi:hypothetical protein